MAGRPVDVRLRASGWLRTLSPLRVGGLGHQTGHHADGELAVAVDGLSRPYVPGTSLAGACRAWMTGAVDDRRLDHLWGFTESRTDAGTASRVFVRDGLVCSAPDEAATLQAAQLDMRTSVGVDRHTGAAVRALLSSRAVIPAGAFVRFELVVESSTEQAALDGARLAALLRALRAGEVRLGAASRVGFGRVELLAGFELVEDDLGSKAGLLDLLRGSIRRPRTVDDLEVDPGLTGRSTARFTISWTPLAPVMVCADRAGAAVDALPLTTVDADGALRLVVPGSSVKGALRAHAERILRTLHDAPAPSPSPAPSPAPQAGPDGGQQAAAADAVMFRDQLAGATATPTATVTPTATFTTGGRLSTGGRARSSDPLALAKALFGLAPDRGEARSAPPSRVVEVPASVHAPTREFPAGAQPPAGPEFGAGALRVSDCMSVRVLDAEIWRQVTVASDVVPERATLAGWGLEAADHAAIDRWTGSATDAQLFTVLEPWKVDWQPVVVEVDLARLARVAGDDPELADRALALLLLLLRDFAGGRVPLGHGTHRGFGDLRAKVCVEAPDTDGPVDLDRYLFTPKGRSLAVAWSAHVRDLARRRGATASTSSARGGAPPAGAPPAGAAPGGAGRGWSAIGRSTSGWSASKKGRSGA